EIRQDATHQTPVSRGLRAFMAVRNRWSEDRLSQAVGAGVVQYVVLGAGLDTFSLRNPFPNLRVFEVDHPATQAFKRERIAAAGLEAHATYVGIDFARQTLAVPLRD